MSLDADVTLIGDLVNGAGQYPFIGVIINGFFAADTCDTNGK
jgi:hypothetical protein